MKLFDLFYFCFQSFKNRKSRILLTILGISVGIGAVLFLVSLGFGLQKTLFERIITKESLLTLDIVPAEARIASLTEETLTKISQFPEVEKVSPQAVFSSHVFLGDLSSEATVNLVEPDFFLLGGILTDMGEAFTEEDEQKIVINSSMAQAFNLEPNQILGKNLSFLIFVPQKEIEGIAEIQNFKPEKEFEVIGIIEDPGEVSQAYLKRGDLMELSIEEYQFAKVMVREDKYLDGTREKLIEMGFLVSALADMVDQATRIFGIIQIVLGVFGTVALIVAGIGLVNTMTISLLQRTSDIGIMRANGASPWDIKRIFLIESLIIGFLGGIIGVFVGIFAGETFNFGLNILAGFWGGQVVDIFYYPSWFIIFVISLSSLMGLIGGYWPAKRAAKLNPLEALRYK